MNLRMQLSDLEADWAFLPWEEKENSREITGHILVAGCGDNPYVEVLLVSLGAGMEEEPHNRTIYFYNIDGSPESECVKQLFQYRKIQRYHQGDAASFSWLILDAGQQNKCTFESWMEDWVVQRVTLISNYRIYASEGRGCVFSENEILPEESDALAWGYAAWEQKVIHWAEKRELTYSILRPGELVGGISAENPLQNMIRKLASGDDESVTGDRKKYPSIYVGDFLRAVFWCGRNSKSGIWNVSTANLSQADILFYLRDVKQLQRYVEIIAAGEVQNSLELSMDRLILDGWEPWVLPEDYILYAFAYFYKPQKLFAYKDYLPDVKLERIQELLMEMLRQVDYICKKHEIPYFLAGGTLLGAIRNQGFLPWDNDLDLMMTREAYSRFLQVAKQELPEQMFLQVAGNDPENHFYSKIRLNHTLLITPFNAKHTALHNGIFLDIFPQDATADKSWGQKLHIAATIVARSMVFNKWGNTEIAGDGSHPWLRRCFSVVKNCLPMSVLETIQYRTIRFFEWKKEPQFLYDGMGQNIRRGAFPAKWLSEEEHILFEGEYYPAPRASHAYLEYLYGKNYRYPVSLRKRKKEHNIQLVDLGPHLRKRK